MPITLESILEIAGVRGGQDSVEVLRDGFPSYVIRVRTDVFPGRPTVVVKACSDASLEQAVLLHLHRAGLPVPAVLDIRQGDGFRAVVLEDVGRDALYKHADIGSYLRAVEEIAGIHRWFEAASMDAASCPSSDLAEALPRYDLETWVATVRAAMAGTLRRLEDGTYTEFDRREAEEVSNTLRVLEQRTLTVIHEMPEFELAYTLVHGDYHDGNVLIRPSRGEEAGQVVIVDWDSARWDSGFFDLASLYDVADRMGTYRMDPAQVMEVYLRERFAGGSRPSQRTIETEWHRCCLLRAWNELRWFSETGEDFGDRVLREIEIIRSHVSWF